MWREKFRQIFHKVQQSSSCHQKCRQILYNLYKEVEFEEFEIEFMRCIEIMFGQDVLHKNLYADKSLEFAATFVTYLTNLQSENKTNNESDSEDSEVETHPFLNSVIRNTLVNHNIAHVSVRYRTCQFIDLILRNIGEDAHIENDLWNIILECLLERIKDMKPVVRIQAVRALARLQSPMDTECPVIHAFLERMYDCNTTVRKEIVEVIAPTPLTTSKIVEKVRDADHTVRLAAYRKCSKMGPKMVKLVDRQSVVMNGFNEMHDAVKRCFLEDTLPKWLSAYNGDYLKLFYALKVDAFAEDMKQTEIVCKKVLELFLKTHQLSTIIEYLPLDENKYIPFEKLNYETALYWSIIVDYLRKVDSPEDYLDNVIPELLPFCVYMEKIVQESYKAVEGWKYIENQHILHQLILIAGNYDLGDEAGRKALRALVVNMLTTMKLEEQNIREIISILANINPVLDSLTIDICSIISDIREPLVAQQPTEDMARQNDFKLAELRVRINILKDDCDEAVKQCDYNKAATIKKQLAELNNQMQQLTEQFESDKVMLKTTQNDPETTCRCLNILIGVLSYPQLKTLTVALRSCKDELIMPLCNSNNPEINWRVYKCLALCCTLDQQLAKDSLKLLCSPIILYRLTPQDQTVIPVLLISIAAVADILRLYGTNIFASENDATENGENTNRRRTNGARRLYRVEDMDDSENYDFNSVTWKDIVDILLDTLDDENADLREESCKAVCELLIEKIAVSSELLARLILKWFNPLTEKHDQKLQLLLGNTFVYFAQLEGTEEIIEKAVIPVLTQLGNAPPTSPLVDIDIDNALRFLSAISSIRRQPEIIDIHKNLAYDLCHRIANKLNDKCVPIYIKMLLNLELSLEDAVIIKELNNQVELILEDLVDRVPKRNMQKFSYKLKALLLNNNNEQNEEVLNNEENIEQNGLSSEDEMIVENHVQTNENRTSKSLVPVEMLKENTKQKGNVKRSVSVEISKIKQIQISNTKNVVSMDIVEENNTLTVNNNSVTSEEITKENTKQTSNTESHKSTAISKKNMTQVGNIKNSVSAKRLKENVKQTSNNKNLTCVELTKDNLTQTANNGNRVSVETLKENNSQTNIPIMENQPTKENIKQITNTKNQTSVETENLIQTGNNENYTPVEALKQNRALLTKNTVQNLCTDPSNFLPCTVIIKRMAGNLQQQIDNTKSSTKQKLNQISLDKNPASAKVSGENIKQVTNTRSDTSVEIAEKTLTGTDNNENYTPVETLKQNRALQTKNTNLITPTDLSNFRPCNVIIKRMASDTQQQNRKQADNTKSSTKEKLKQIGIKNPVPMGIVKKNKSRTKTVMQDISTDRSNFLPCGVNNTVTSRPQKPNFFPCTVVVERMTITSIPQKNNVTTKLLNRTSERLSMMSMNELSPVKRRKQRGRRSKTADKSINLSDATILHTIVENDDIERRSLLDDDLTIETVTSTDSRISTRSSNGIIEKSRQGCKKVIISETSSDSDDNRKVTRSNRRFLNQRTSTSTDSRVSTRNSNGSIIGRPRGKSKKGVVSESSSESDDNDNRTVQRRSSRGKAASQRNSPDSSKKKPSRGSIRKKKKQRYI